MEKHDFYGYCNEFCIDLANHSHVYIINIVGTDFYKIGKTKCLIPRLRDYQSASPFNHKFIAVFSDSCIYNISDIEQQMLKLFLDYKVKGEWIKLSNQKMLIDSLFEIGDRIINDSFLTATFATGQRRN